MLLLLFTELRLNFLHHMQSEQHMGSLSFASIELCQKEVSLPRRRHFGILIALIKDESYIH